MKKLLKKSGVVFALLVFAGLALWTALGGITPEITGASGKWLQQRAKQERQELGERLHGISQALLRAPQKAPVAK